MRSITSSLFVVFLFLYGCKLKPAEKKNISKNIKVEFYARKSDWTARFPGKDDQLGPTRYWMISPDNRMGLMTPDGFRNQLKKRRAEQDSLEQLMIQRPEDYTLQRSYTKLLQLLRRMENSATDTLNCSTSYDDIIVNKEIYLPVDSEINAYFRSQDVIHGAFISQLRLNAKCIPGMTTTFNFSLKKTTADMRKALQQPGFDYYLVCNNICGPEHYQMRLKIKVVEMEDYLRWLQQQSVQNSSNKR